MSVFTVMRRLWLPLVLLGCNDARVEEPRPPQFLEARFDVAYSVSGPPDISGLTLFFDVENDAIVYGVREAGKFETASDSRHAAACGSTAFGCFKPEYWPPVVSGQADNAVILDRYDVGPRLEIDDPDTCYGYSVSDRETQGLTTYSMTCDPYGVVFFSFRKEGVVNDHILRSYNGLFRQKLELQ